MEVTLIDHMGSDMTVVNAARVSFAKEKAILDRSDERLINYLAKHNHWTPFAHCTATFRIKAPIFVARQLFKHKVGLTENEVSRRYVDDEPEFWVPDYFRQKAEDKKQGSLDEPHPDSENWVEAVWWVYNKAEQTYKLMIRDGVAPEQARAVLPQSMMTEWYWTGSLSAFARVCKQRISKDAQAETGEIAKMIHEELRILYPFSWNALTAG
jgi:thymidylate synthase (FAD)